MWLLASWACWALLPGTEVDSGHLSAGKKSKSVQVLHWVLLTAIWGEQNRYNTFKSDNVWDFMLPPKDTRNLIQIYCSRLLRRDFMFLLLVANRLCHLDVHVKELVGFEIHPSWTFRCLLTSRWYLLGLHIPPKIPAAVPSHLLPLQQGFLDTCNYGSCHFALGLGSSIWWQFVSKPSCTKSYMH